VLVDVASAPQLEALAKSEPALVLTVSASLDMRGAMEEVAKEANTGKPGEELRELFVKLGGMAKRRDLAGALPLSAAATSLATSQGWPHLAAAVQVLLAGIYAAAHKPLEALRCYAEVDRFGQGTYALGEASDEPLPGGDGCLELKGDVAKACGLRLPRDARLGQGAILIAERAWEQGARVFLEASTFSGLFEDVRGQLDGLRLASFCYEQWKKPNEAWQCGLKALMVANEMDAETRRSSTLGELGKGMLRIARSFAIPRASKRDIEQQMVELLGPDWQASSAPAVEVAAP
jgi:hypothetical protein